jgi:hypothetical protein
VDVLSRMLDTLVPGGIVLDLQVIRPDPRIEVDGCVVGGLDGEPLLLWAEAAAAAIDACIEAGELLEEAADDHDVLSHFLDGANLVEHVTSSSMRRLPEDVLPIVLAIERPLVLRERCRLRRLRLCR